VVAVLVILDGASEPLCGDAPTSLERATTPTLDVLAAEGVVLALRTVPTGLLPGSESAIPALLGWTPPAPVDRGMLEAAARGVTLAPPERAWRIDVVDATSERAAGSAVARAAAELQAAVPHHRVHRLAGHRLLATGVPPLPLAAHAAGLRVWPEGLMPPRVLDARTVVVGAAGAAIGAARLMGAETIVPAGATGDVDTDLAGKTRAALDALADGAKRVVVHVGAPDEAAHRRDRAAKVAAIERIDRELIAPLAAAVRRAGGTLRVCPDHGCDPATGEHDGAPVPCVDWPARTADAAGGARLTERAVAGLPVAELAAPEAVAA
jgi:2,3-bisphosphoglycerate-independent phosphoglycerate mutase